MMHVMTQDHARASRRAARNGVGGIKQYVRRTCAALVTAHAIKTVLFGGEEHLKLTENRC
jgi:hypothetical protein